MVIVLVGAAAFAYGLGTFTTGQIRDELTAQQVFFPGKDQIKAGGALDPAVFSQEIRDQAGTQVTDGNQARIYANDFIAKHLEGTANGLTYASIGTKISQLKAQQASLSKDDPAYTDLQNQITTLTAQRETLFKGETLRSSLLNAYGWWTIGTYTTYAAFGLMLAAIVVLGALVFEVVVARRPRTVMVGQKAKAISTTA
jgi:hypothetical protein